MAVTSSEAGSVVRYDLRSGQPAAFHGI